MKIGKDLRLVLPIETTKGASYVYASAVGKEVFDRFYDMIALAFARVYATGGGQMTGPRVAARFLRGVAKERGRGAQDGQRTALDDLNEGFFAEMRRLANVAVIGANGWEMVPIEDAANRGMIDEDDLDEVENALTFFTLAWLMHRRVEREAILTEAMGLWHGRLTSLDYTAFVASLPTLTATDNSGARAPA